MVNLKSVILSGKEVLPIIEGGKGVAVSSGLSAGAFAAAGAIGTFSGVNPDRYDEDGNYIPPVYKGKTRKERHEELVQMGIEGGVTQARIAHETSGGNGRIHINVLWEMGGAERVLHGVLERARGLVHGITCGAGMPYRLGEIAQKYGIYYYPIVSSMRAFRALWKRAYRKTSDFLGGVVYEDPWLAGGHNGLSNSENPKEPQDPYPRVAQLRKFMNEVGLERTPIVMAGGVWHIKDWESWLNNPEIGEIVFQFGTRPIVTQESPVSQEWKKRLLQLEEGDVLLNKFSPTGFYSSAVRNGFMRNLEARSERQMEYRAERDEEFSRAVAYGRRGRQVFVREDDGQRAERYLAQGFDTLMKTPDGTIIFVEQDESRIITKDQADCMGCLSHCAFSNWKDHDDYTTGRSADPRSFCIQKTLQNIAHGSNPDGELMFSGHNAYRFASDPFYKDGFIPTVKQLVDRIRTGY